ncbi:substrate-binding domain-containing protein [soil metagenome]
MHNTARAAMAALLLVATTGLAACGANDSDSGSGDGGSSATIALLLPESSTTRYESFDKPLFEAQVKKDCADCTVKYFNADQDEDKQADQVDSAISQGVDVIVLDPVNGKAAAAKVADAKDADIPVIAYDRFIEGADYYMSFDNETVGKLQAQALVDATGDKGDILMLNGSPDDPNAAQFKKGAHSVLDDSGLNIVAEYDNPDWSAGNAQDFTKDQLDKASSPSDFAGIYAANDGQAGGVIAALTDAGLSGDEIPPVTGQDAELAAIQRIVAGEQYMTINKPYPIEANKAGAVAVLVAQGKKVTGTTDFQGVKSFIFDPVVVTQDKVADTVIKDKLYTVEDICTADYADACAEAGLEK